MTPKTKKVKTDKVRVRMAPSPTGFLHIGNARIALFNYLFAKQNSGDIVLRIEDTDTERSKLEFEKEIMESLKWLGLEWSEGPYHQSERKDIYQKYLKQLLDSGQAYYCFCSEEELEARKQYQMSMGKAPKYDGKCTNLPKDAVNKLLAEGKSYVVRFKNTAKKISFEDIIKGKVGVDASLFGDIVIAKNLENVLYNFAVVIDDFEMKISHVIRGEDHLSNTPKQILIQEALELPRPQYAHIPLTLGPDKAKMSKRHGATAVSEYRKEGYLPETLINFMAFLGWNPGDEREIFSLPALIKEFSLEKMQKSAAIFNQVRLDYLNGFYIRHKSIDKLTELCVPYLVDACLIKEGEGIMPSEKLKKIVAIHQERLKKLSEIADLASYFFIEPNYSKEMLIWKDMSEEEIGKSLKNSLKTLEKIAAEGEPRQGREEKKWNKENLEKVLLTEAGKLKNRGELLWPLRVALTGREHSAGPFEVADILGKEETLKRINEAIKKL